MAAGPHSTDLCNSLASNADRDSAAVPYESESTAKVLRRRFDRDRGALLGGVCFGVGGWFLGASMPCQHWDSVAISAIWWGIYMGCFGLSLGALLGLWAGSTLASRRGDAEETNSVGVATDIESAAPEYPQSLILARTKCPGNVPVPLQAHLIEKK
jgi:hypothetical protein